MISEKAKWIWCDAEAAPEEYVSFEKKFVWESGECRLKICAETNYIACLNGQRVGFGQFAGYPEQKYYDEIDLEKYVISGENVLQITVRYEGIHSFVHMDDGAGLLFEVAGDSGLLAVSDETVKACYDPRYVLHEPHQINFALGYACNMKNEVLPEHTMSCKVLARECRVVPRPVQKLIFAGRYEAKACCPEKKIYDVGFETAGYMYLKIEVPQDCVVKVAWGEHLEDGEVRRKVGAHDFSLDFHCRKGENYFEQLFVRLGCRYLQLYCEQDIKVHEIGIYEAKYPVAEKNKLQLPELDRKIYDTCIRTLRLCMHEHYEDCPWREQALYALDSRNQMLCGYYVFEGAEYQRANLVFISRSRDDNGLLTIVSPKKSRNGIPFFSLMYVVAVYEYIFYTGDTGILEEVWDAVLSIMQTYQKQINANGLVTTFEKPYWNFYEWSEYSWQEESGQENLILNCAFVYACERFRKLCEWKNETPFFSFDTEEMKQTVQKHFYSEETGLYFVSTAQKTVFNQLGNAMAMLIGLGDARTYQAVKSGEGVIPATLSMRGFVYDAILEADHANEEFILNDIRERYKAMLDAGATSFWETESGAAAFDRSGSLCHAWSALPVIYYQKFFRKNREVE